MKKSSLEFIIEMQVSKINELTLILEATRQYKDELALENQALDEENFRLETELLSYREKYGKN